MVEIFKAGKESGGDDVDSALEEALVGIDQSDLDYNRYGDTFFEVVFTGWLLGTSSDDKGKKDDDDLNLNVLASGVGIAGFYAVYLQPTP